MIKDDSRFKQFFFYAIELAIAAAFLWLDQRLFFLYCFGIFLWKLDNNLVATGKAMQNLYIQPLYSRMIHFQK